MLDIKMFQNPVDLKWLNLAKLSLSPRYYLVLDDDIWKNKTLLVKKGGKLNYDMIDKLINFGVKETKVKIVEKDYADYDNLNLIKNQSILIVQKDFKSISKHAKMLINAGFANQNIFASNSVNFLSKYLQNKSLCYVFIDYSLYGKKAINIIKNSIYNRTIDLYILNTPIISNENFIEHITESHNQNSINIMPIKQKLNITSMKAIIATSQNSKYKQLLDKKQAIEFKNAL